MNILQQLVADAQQKKQQLQNSIGNGIAHIGAAPHPVNIAPAPVVSAIQNAKYGVLAHNPAAQQSVIHQLQTPVARPSVGTGLNNAMGAFNDTTAHAGRIIGQNIVTRPAMEIAQTARQAITHKQSGFTPGSPQMKYIFGDSPIQSLQANHATTQAGLQHSSNPLVRGTAPVLAGANTLLHIANDVPLAGAALKAGVKGSAALAPKAVQAAERIAPKAAPVLAKGAEALQGAAQTLDKGAVATTKAIGSNIKAASNKRGTIANYDATISDLQKQKADLQRRIQNAPIDNHIGVEHTQRHIDQLDGKIAQVVASKPKLTLKDRVLAPNVGLSMKSVTGHEDLTPDQHEFIGQYAEMLKGMGQGNGVDLAPGADGGKIRVSNNYRDPSLGSGRMTNGQWFDHAREQIESGKASHGASEEYKALSQPPAEEPLQLPEGWDTIGNPTVAPKAKPAPARPEPSGKRQLPASRGTGGVSLPNGSKQTKFTSQTVQKSPQVSDPVKAQTDASYTPGKNAETVGTVKEQIAQQGLKPALNETLDKLNVERGTAHRDTLAKAIEIAKQHDALGTPEDQAIAAHLYDLVGEHGSAKGQGAQILATIARSSPAGLRNKAINDLKKAGVTVTDEMQKEIQGHINTIASMKDGPAKDMAIAVLQKAVAKHLPQSVVDKGIGIWKAGLLSGVKTQQGNAISNGTFAVMKKVSDAPATLADKLMSIKTGQRTKTTTMRGVGSGTVEGVKNGITTLKTGIDPRNIGDKYEQHAEINFSNPILNAVLAKPANMVFRGMNAADQPFWYSALKNSLYDQAKADGFNKGLKGQELLDHMNKTVANPTEAMADRATAEANKATLNYDTVGSKAVQFAHKGIDSTPGITKAGAKIAHSVVDFLAPFVRVPSAFISRTADFTPLGIGKEVFHQVASGKFDQRQLSQAIGEGATGTGVIALGVALSQQNLISGDYPKNDPKEAQRWKTEGITPNSVKIYRGKDSNGKDKYTWMNMNYLGPVGLLFNAGQQLEQAKGEGAMIQAGKAIGGLGQGLLGQSFLQGFTGFSDAIKDPNRNLKSFVNSQASSVVPSIVNDAANFTDRFQRQADTVGQSIKNRIPGLREQNKVKQDVYGNPLKQPAGALNTLNGLKPSDSLTNNSPAIAEVNRLHSVDPNNTDLQVTPTPITSVTIPGANKGDKSTSIKLNSNQKYDLQKQVGQSIQSNWNKIIASPAYQADTDSGKAKRLTQARQDATELATRKYVTDNNLGSYSKAASKGATALASGNLNKYTGATNGSSSVSVSDKIDPHSQKVLGVYNSLNADQNKQKAYSEPSWDYKVAQAKYDNAVANGTLSKAQAISQKQAVQKAKIGASFSKDTRDLYGLSKQEVYDLITTDPNGKKYAADLLAYGDALKSAGIEKNKFRTSKGVESFGDGTNSATKASSGSKTSLSTLLAGFKTPYSDMVKNSTKGASLARNAHLSKKKA